MKKQNGNTKNVQIDHRKIRKGNKRNEKQGTGVPAMAQWVKNPVLQQLWCRSQLQLGFKTLARELPYATGAAIKKYVYMTPRIFGGVKSVLSSLNLADCNQLQVEESSFLTLRCGDAVLPYT